MTKLAQALHAFQKDAPPIHLDATNPHFRNKYASLGGVVAAIRPALNKHGLVYTQVTTNLDGSPALKTTLIHAESGETLEGTSPLVLAKADPQGYGSALTYQRRYSLLSILGLVGDDDDDANSAQPAQQNGSTFVKPANAPEKATMAGTDPGEVVLTFGKWKGTKIKDVDSSYLSWWLGQEPPKTEQQRAQRTAAELFMAGVSGVATEVGPGEFSDETIPF